MWNIIRPELKDEHEYPSDSKNISTKQYICEENKENSSSALKKKIYI